MAANKKKVLCTLIVREIDVYGGQPSREVRVEVEETSVAHAFQKAQERAMARLKRQT